MSESEHTGDSPPNAPPHHAPNGKFRNPWGLAESRFAGLLRWRWNRVRHPLPRDDGARSLRCVPPAVRVPRAAANEIAVTWVGHSTLLVQLGSVNILTDPIWSDRASPWRLVGPRRLIPAALPLNGLPPIDIVLLSHNHYDHLDAWSVRALARAQPTAQWVVPLRLGGFVRSLGVRYITELDWWDERTVGDATVACTPARHFSARTPLDRDRTLWCGFAVASAAGRLFYAGDTGLHPEFARIGERFGPFVVSAIPIGAYEPRWFMQPVHVDPDDAITAFRALHAHHGSLARAVMVGVHWGTFRLTDEPILAPPQRARAAWTRAMLPDENLWVLAHGETRGIRMEQRGTASSFLLPRRPASSHVDGMEHGLTVYRHDSPGGRIVIITVDERNPNDVVARLQVERRADPERQGVGEPPLIAEARGTSREAVLTELQALATDDAELARRLARWTAMQRRPRSDAP